MSTFGDVVTLVQSHLSGAPLEKLASGAEATGLYLAFAKSAQRRVISEMRQRDIQRATFQTTYTLPASTTTLQGSTVATGFVTPLVIWERASGGTALDWGRLQKVDHLPDQAAGGSLGFWAWRSGVLQFIGATADRQLRVEYTAFLADSTGTTDDVLVVDAIDCVSYLAASEVARAIKEFQLAEGLRMDGEAALERLLQVETHAEQYGLRRPLPYGDTTMRRLGV